MKDKIFHNLGLKLASLLLAVLLWFLVAQTEDPQETAVFTNIPVRLTNTELLESQNKMYEILDDSATVTVRVRAPKSVTKNLRSTDIVAVADMSKLTEINTIAIAYTVQNIENSSIKSITGDHDVVSLNVEDKLTKNIRVRYSTTGTPAEGYQVVEMGLDQNLIEVSGPQSAVEKISYAAVSMNVDGSTAQMSMNVEPILYDRDGKPLDLPNVSRNVNYVLMSVKVLAVKEVPVVFSVTGTPAEGYLATGEVQCSPASFQVAATPSVLSSFESIEIAPEQLDMTGLTENMVRVISIKEYLNTRNIRLLNNSRGDVTITAFIEPKVEKTCTIQTDQLTLLRIPDGYRVEFAEVETPYELHIAGLNDTVTEIQRTVKGTIDFALWMRHENITVIENHTYEVPVSFFFPDTVDVLNEVKVSVNFIPNEQP